MNNPDLLLVLCSRLNNSALRSLSLNPVLWPLVSEVIKSQYFWYLRTQDLVGRELAQRSGRDWKSAYYLLESALTLKNKYTREVLHNLLAVEVLLELGFDPSINDDYAIRWASDKGHVGMVKLLLRDERVDPSADDNSSIELASKNGHTEVVRLLLEDTGVDPSADNNVAILIASQNGHTEVVKLLLQDKRVDPSADNNVAIRRASQNGHADVVKLLLQDKRVDPSADNNYAILIASQNRHPEVVKLLLQRIRRPS